MNLAQPSWLILLVLPVLLALGAWLRSRRARDQWRKLVAPKLIAKLFQPRARWRRWVSLSCGLLGLALLVVVLCEPHAGVEGQDAAVRGRNVLVAIDVSRSMLVDDVPPNRLGAAKAASLEIIDQLATDRIGLIAFAGTAFLQAPLTLDHAALRDTVDQLGHGVIPTGGSNLASVVEEAAATFEETGQDSHALIIISDGEDHDDRTSEALGLAEEYGMVIVAIAIGTEEGKLIPDEGEQDGVYRDPKGQPVVSAREVESLRELALGTNGRLIEGTGRAFTSQIREALDVIEEYHLGTGERERLIVRYQYFLFPALVLFAVSLLSGYFVLGGLRRGSGAGAAGVSGRGVR